jgi:trk system potassium uptake protein TrkH
MFFSPVIYVIGWFLLMLGIAMFIPAAADRVVGNSDWAVFALSGAATIFVGVSFVLTTRGAPINITLRQGFLLTTGSWVTVALFGALPFAYSDLLALTYTDAFFESMSGLTTTGATVLSGLDQLPPGVLLWRGLLQWFGGIGIIVMAVAMFPLLKVGGMQLFRMESSDRSEKAMSSVKRYTAALVLSYVALSLVCTALLRFAGMTWLESAVHAMTTLSTGGYSTSDASLGHWDNPVIHWIITAFMLLGALPFVVYIHMVRQGPASLLRDSQIRAFLTFLVTVIGLITAWLWWSSGFSLEQAFRETAFNVVSVVTTTGYAVSDYSRWGTMPFGVFFMLIFVGGCTGSTGGGIKMFRFQILWMAFRAYIWSRVYPHGVRALTYDRRPVSSDVVLGVLVFILIFLMTVVVTSLILEGVGLDLVTALSGAATAVANVGPGLGDIIGPAGTFASLPAAAKWVLAIAMLLGRLEFLTVLVLFSPGFWRR